MNPKYVDLFIHRGVIKTKEDKEVEILELDECNDEDILVEWANNFRRNYCLDENLEIDIVGTGFTKEEYILKNIFPDKYERPGPSVRSGDFSEILLLDYLEYTVKYYTPRTRYDHKDNPNSSPMGVDLLAFKLNDENNSCNDELIVFEVKSKASSGGKNNLQKAINDSIKDIKKISMSLYATKSRLRDKNKMDEYEIVKRFENKIENEYILSFGAVFVVDSDFFNYEEIENSIIKNHIDNNLKMIVIKKQKLMNFINELYRRASIC